MSQALDRIMSQDLSSWRTNGTQCLAPQATPRRSTSQAHHNSSHAARHTSTARRNTEAATETAPAQINNWQPTANAFAAPMWQDQVFISPEAAVNFDSFENFDIDDLDDAFDAFDIDDAFDSDFANDDASNFDSDSDFANDGAFNTTDKVDINFDALYA